MIYLLAVLLVPNIPLFYLYGRNAAQGLLFKHFLIMGGVLAVISLVIYLLVSKLYLRRRRTVVLITLCWAAFWFFHPLGKILTRGGADFSKRNAALYLMFLIVMSAFILRHINMSRLVANTIAVLLCFLFAFNFVPHAMAVSSGEKQRTYNEKTGEMPYKIKTEFKVDSNLPKPNVYWLHMDGMVGFDAVERYFNDPQTALKNALTERGFVINKSARTKTINTFISVPSMSSPTFYDSYLAGEFARVAHLTVSHGGKSIYKLSIQKGISWDNIHSKTELLNAFSNAGYLTISNIIYYQLSKDLNIRLIGNNVNSPAGDLNIYIEANRAFNNLVEFKELITSASALSFYFISHQLDKILEKIKPISNTQPLPAYPEIVGKYVTGSDSDDSMANMVKSMKYSALIQSPHFVYFSNLITHCIEVNSTEIGGVAYEAPIGSAFILDENGNVYKERLEDPHDIQLYLPQHKYAVKQMMAQVDIIIEDDPDAVIILQGDHGISGIGNSEDYIDSRYMSTHGYSPEDQVNLSLQVMSAVRIPPQYGKLSQPLDPLDIARYLVNNFVGKGNYDFLYYTEESSQ